MPTAVAKYNRPKKTAGPTVWVVLENNNKSLTLLSA
jgi:hypothetical protein